ncbi:unnamed protein product [Diplocarpon coronariae]
MEDDCNTQGPVSKSLAPSLVLLKGAVEEKLAPLVSRTKEKDGAIENDQSKGAS